MHAHAYSNWALLFLISLLPLSVGCGDNRFPVRPAKGKVVCNGQPVTIGSVSFIPIGAPGALETGKTASAAIKQDGTFILTTFDRFDGAIVGKHRVQYNLPESDGSDEEGNDSSDPDAPGTAAKKAEQLKQKQAMLKLQCVLKGELIVEVKSTGDNDFTIELSPAGK